MRSSFAFLLSYGGDGDCGGEGHVYRYGFFVIESSDLSVRYMCAILKLLTVFWRLGRFHCDLTFWTVVPRIFLLEYLFIHIWSDLDGDICRKTGGLDASLQP